MKIIEKFEVPYLQILDEFGKSDAKLLPNLDKKDLIEMYKSMLITCAFDDKALKLQRQGRLGTYASMRGQEACQVGSAFALDKSDWVFPAFRENGIFMMRGIPAHMLFQYWAGDERGMQIPKGINILPVSITVGAHLPHAVGAAMAFKHQGMKNASVVYFGDGATSEGDFHEALNFAGVFKTPCVFICQNNQWAISTPVSEQTASKTIAQKAIAYGIPGILVDGNDVFAVYRATLDALERARRGEGSTLIECFTYRLSDHTTSDDSKKYRSDEEVREWEKKDPMLRFENYLLGAKILNPVTIQKMKIDAEQLIEREVRVAESMTAQPPTDMFDYLYASRTSELEEQRVQSAAENEIAGRTGASGHSAKNGGVVGELEEA